MIDLRPITPDNHVLARKLAVHPHQEKLVAAIDKSLADAFVYEDALFRVAYEADRPVGYTLVFPFDQDEQRLVNIVRVMIDARYQGRGLGRELLGKTLEWIRSFSPAVDKIRISTLPDNKVALGLYRAAGFVERGTEDGDIAMYMDLKEMA